MDTERTICIQDEIVSNIWIQKGLYVYKMRSLVIYGYRKDYMYTRWDR